jgi:tetratricopeptide (TPR) repeat protein
MDSTETKPELHAAESHSQSPLFQSSLFQSDETRRLILCLLLALATIALYSSVFRAPFLNYDDDAYVTGNVHVRAGVTWSTVVWAFRSTELSDWKPIAWLSHALDCQIFGLNPMGPHIINVLLHAANAVLLFLILESATGFAWRSLVVAALFALHPMNVESVAWIAERKNVLSMFFFLLALAAYGWYARRPGIGRYLTVTLAYALGLMTKAQVITFPFVLLLLDYWPLERLAPPQAPDEHAPPFQAASFWKLVVEKVPWFALSAASAVITMRAETDAKQLRLPLWAHLGNAALSYVKYLERAFWPMNLAAVYPHPELSISIPAAVLSAVVIIAISISAVIFRQRRPFFVGWFWFLGTLVPMIGLVQIGVHGMADRYAYIPLLGIFVIVCWGAADFAKTWHVPTVAPAIVATVILLALGAALHRQVGFWNDNVTLWAHAVEVTDGNFTAEDNLAGALIAKGRVDEAMPHLRRARFLRPDDLVSTLNIASYEQMHGNYKAAIDGYARVPLCTTDPSLLAMARVNSGYARFTLKQYDQAKQDFEATLRYEPGSAAAYRGLGLLAQRAGDTPQAIRDYERAVEIQPTSLGYLLLARALESDGHAEAARAAEAQAAGMTRDLNGDLASVKQLLAE